MGEDTKVSAVKQVTETIQQFDDCEQLLFVDGVVLLRSCKLSRSECHSRRSTEVWSLRDNTRSTRAASITREIDWRSS